MDLRTVTATAAQLQRKQAREDDRLLELEAMQAHALIRYGRCFRGGVRTAFLVPDDWIEALPPELRQAHRDFLDLRDKHIAHSVNDWEINTPVARVAIDRATGEMVVRQVHVSQSRVVMQSSESLDLLWRLAKVLADRVEQEMRVESAKLLEVAKKIPLDELKRRLIEDPTNHPGTRGVGKARRRR
jgi:hypothetical protein